MRAPSVPSIRVSSRIWTPLTNTSASARETYADGSDLTDSQLVERAVVAIVIQPNPQHVQNVLCNRQPKAISSLNLLRLELPRAVRRLKRERSMDKDDNEIHNAEPRRNSRTSRIRKTTVLPRDDDDEIQGEAQGAGAVRMSALITLVSCAD